uniref:Uncharacterized protein n=2 Tax=Peronospora matthiolae TaxID=2874970 RepID=A0AAV1UUK5_9STRA
MSSPCSDPVCRLHEFVLQSTAGSAAHGRENVPQWIRACRYFLPAPSLSRVCRRDPPASTRYLDLHGESSASRSLHFSFRLEPDSSRSLRLMDFLNKAKHAAELYAGGDTSKSHTKSHKDKSGSGSVFTKAADAAEKYHAKEKVAEFAQKRVAKRDMAKQQPGYVDKKDKSAIDKAVEAAEDFLAKQQGQAKGHHSGGKKDQHKEEGTTTL